MSMIFYWSPLSSAIPVASALRELEIPHERVHVDLQKGEQRRPEFLARNPFGKVPTLVADGTPMFESLAIMQWLGDRYGVARGVWPAADAPARLPAMAWSTWAYVTYGAAIYRLVLSTDERVPPELRSERQAKETIDDMQKQLAVLDARLSDHPFVLGDDFSLADLIVHGCVAYGAVRGAKTDAHPHVHAWVERCFARPSIAAEWRR